MEHADEFMQCDDNIEVFNYSPLYRINQIPNYVINALGLCGIHTVEDLLDEAANAAEKTLTA